MVARGSRGSVAASTLAIGDLAPVRVRTMLAASAVLVLNTALMLAPPTIGVLALLSALR